MDDNKKGLLDNKKTVPIAALLVLLCVGGYFAVKAMTPETSIYDPVNENQPSEQATETLEGRDDSIPYEPLNSETESPEEVGKDYSNFKAPINLLSWQSHPYHEGYANGSGEDADIVEYGEEPEESTEENGEDSAGASNVKNLEENPLVPNLEKGGAANLDILSEEAKVYQKTDLFSYASTLPTEKEKWGEDEDGEETETTEKWSQEAFLNHSSYILERLRNPIYGDWVEYQHPEGGVGYGPITPLINMVTKEYLEKCGEETPECIPMFYDRDKNDYGMDNLPAGPRWFGEYSNLAVTRSEVDGRNNAAKITGDVTFTTNLTTGGKTVKHGKIMLELVDNTGEPFEPYIRINDAKLTITD